MTYILFSAKNPLVFHRSEFHFMCSTIMSKDVHSSTSKLWIKIIIKIIDQIFMWHKLSVRKQSLKIRSWPVCGTVNGNHPQYKRKEGLDQFKWRETLPMLQEKSAKCTVLFHSIPTSLLVLQLPFPAAAHSTRTQDLHSPSCCPNGENSMFFSGGQDYKQHCTNALSSSYPTSGTCCPTGQVTAKAQCHLLALGTAISPKCPWSCCRIFLVELPPS